MKLKAKRFEVMRGAIESVLGTGFSQEKCEVTLVGTPLKYQWFL